MDVNTYINNIEPAKKEMFLNFRKTIIDNLPKGFNEEISYGMVGYVVPHSVYPSGYHCNTKLPLPFMSLAAQKNSINFYHMGIYASKNLYDWFINEYAKMYTKKLDIGKSCMRFKKQEDIPFDLIAQLITKVSVENWIETYEKNYKR